MREHPVIGERILRAIPGMGSVARIVRHEHERFDGSGYPDGLAGEDDPARQPHHPRLRRLPRDDLRPPVPRARWRTSTRSPSWCAARARSSTRGSSRRSSGSSAAGRRRRIRRRRCSHPGALESPRCLKLAGRGHRLRRRRPARRARGQRARGAPGAARAARGRGRAARRPARRQPRRAAAVRRRRARHGRPAALLDARGRRAGRPGARVPHGPAPRAGRARARHRRRRLLGHRRRGGAGSRAPSWRRGSARSSSSRSCA